MENERDARDRRWKGVIREGERSFGGRDTPAETVKRQYRTSSSHPVYAYIPSTTSSRRTWLSVGAPTCGYVPPFLLALILTTTLCRFLPRDEAKSFLSFFLSAVTGGEKPRYSPPDTALRANRIEFYKQAVRGDALY